MFASETFKHKSIQRFRALGSIRAPPEPAAFSFMQRAPENRDVSVLEAQELGGDGVHVVQEETVGRAAGVGECGGEVVGCAVGVEALPPGDCGVVD